VRRTRHRRRFHTDRIVNARRARYLRETSEWALGPDRDGLGWLDRKLSYGLLASRDPWDCGRSCLLCHYDKRLEPRRAREERAWRAEWSASDEG